jgi:hypothetical protein
MTTSVRRRRRSGKRRELRERLKGREETYNVVNPRDYPILKPSVHCTNDHSPEHHDARFVQDLLRSIPGIS